MAQNPPDRQADTEQMSLDVGPVTAYQAPENLPPVPTKAVERRLLVQEIARFMLLFFVLLLLLVIIVFVLFKIRNWDQMREFLEIFVPGLMGALGSAAVFYFADRERR